MRKNCFNESVTSVGNSWVVCRSKSHSGRIYYFNTLTGEAAWNLSEAEIEKAKKTTKIIENTGVRIEGYPEPSDPPHDPAYAIHSFNKCATSNQPKQQHLISPFTGVQCSCNHSNPMNNVGLGIPIASGLNPNIWNFPVAQQLLLANTIPSLLSQTPSTIINMPNKVDEKEIRYVQSTAMPLNQRFKNRTIIGNGYNSSKKIRKFNSWKNNKTGTRSFHHCSTPKNDLRQLLSTRRRRNSSSNNTSLLNAVPQNSGTETCDKEKSDDIQKDADDISPQIKFNVSGLKNIAKHNNDEDLWYIVTDTNVILNNHRFIKTLLDSDKECRLKVPEHVIIEIRNASRSSNKREMNHARRAMFFLSQNIRTGLATTAKDPLMANNTGKSYILDCCLKLIDENYHIVLLCNDKELQNHEKAKRIPMFTLNEVKALLSTSVEDDDSQPSVISLSNKPLIKITISNNQTDTKNENVTQSQEIQLTPFESTKINKEKSKMEAISVGVNSNNLTEVRTMVNVGVQTEFLFDQSSQTSSAQSDNQPMSVTNFKNSDDKQDKLDSDGPSEGKEIKLNRSKSDQSSKNADDITEKTSFKWRRKRRRSLLERFNVPHEQDMNISHASNSTVCNKRLKQGENSELEKQSPGHVSSNSESQVSVGNHHSFVDNVIVEETSTSGIISNTNSNNDSDNELVENSQKDILSISCSNKETETENYKNVMFEITNQAIEENLKRRCDEWVSRFIQIMEEVLTQILQKDPLCFPNSLSPPWTLFEATQCIKMKFRMDCDIVDAATKLSEVLMKISDKKGTININMDPHMYMEMYSFGVYLIDTLQAANNNSEDLQTAAESLAKLLSDIQNPNADTSHNDSFADITREDEVVSDKINIDNTETEVDEYSPAAHQGDLYSPEKLSCSKSLDSPLKYNLRSQWKRTVQKNNDKTVVRFKKTDPETTFFSSLNLQKINEANENEVSPVIEPHTPSSDPPTQCTGLMLNNGDHESNNKNIANEAKSPMQMEVSEPKIIRNFTKCLEFEEKLKNKEKKMLGLHELHDTTEPCLDYEYIEDDYISQDEYEIYDEIVENDNGNEFPAENGHNMPLNIGGNHKFKTIIHRILFEIRETFHVIYAFCEESQKRLKAEPEKNHGEILIKAKETHSHISKLCNALNSICNRDADTAHNNIASILKSEVEGFELEESDLQEYRALMAKCENQANILRETVETIMNHVER
ncbi:unnamed protein product [Parnassius apollo]|uniref:(apollo) hypothetical protein n=1 Tax=Parnassius apollo TaxID=110799 RepID=A0A8S3WPT3_PARAO|nr:unnamed protein product [Parnassius apollo]